MAGEQAVSTPPENESYDAGLFADVQAAVQEANKEPEPVVEKAPEPEAVAEPKADHPTDSTRYADGTFKSQKPAEEVVPAKVEAKTEPKIEASPDGKALQQAVDQAQQQVQGAPPPGWSIKSKAEWDGLPDHIRADIIKREQEVNSGFAQYSGMKELLPYVERARSQGQTLKQVLDSFTGMEDLLRQNPEQGFITIASRLGIPMERLANSFAQYGQSNGQYSQNQGYQLPADGGYQQPQFDPSLLQQWFNPITQQMSQLNATVQTLQQAETTRYSSAFNAAQTRFLAEPDSRYFENVKPLMVQLFQSGIVPETGDHYADLKLAYEKACNLTPEIAELRFKERIAKAEEERRKTEQAAAEKARNASRSITGSPAAGAKIDDDGDDSIEADVRRAVRAHAA